MNPSKSHVDQTWAIHRSSSRVRTKCGLMGNLLAHREHLGNPSLLGTNVAHIVPYTDQLATHSMEHWSV